MKKTRLPRQYPEGVPMKKHPLIFFLEGAQESQRQIALKVAGMTQQSFHEHIVRARKDRDYLLPPVLALKIARHFEVPAWLFRPDVWALGDRGGVL